MSTISIIGNGNMARVLGARAIAGGNTVEIIGRDSARAAALVKELGGSTTAGTFGSVPEGDIVIVALPYESVAPVVRKYGPALQAKVMPAKRLPAYVSLGFPLDKRRDAGAG